MIGVLIVAAYASARAGLDALLAEGEDCQVIGAVSGSAELERVLPEARPDVVLLDENESDTPRVLSLLAGGESGLVMLGEASSGSFAPAGHSLPGWASLLRDAEGVEILAAVRAVAAGLVALDPVLVARLPLAAPLSRPGTPGTDLLPGQALTAREREVLQLLAEGLSNRQIAARLFISPHTAKFHVASILAKLGASSRTEAVALGARRGEVVL
jgi:NarL family two-component system response regulator YdfI